MQIRGATRTIQSTANASLYSYETSQQQPFMRQQQQPMENITFTDGSQQQIVTAQSGDAQLTASHFKQLSQQQQSQQLLQQQLTQQHQSQQLSQKQQTSHGINQFQQQQLTQAVNQPVTYAVQQRSAVIQPTTSLSQFHQPMETEMFEMPDLSSLISDGSSDS